MLLISILLRCSSQGEWDGRGTYHTWQTCEMHRTFWSEYL